MELQNTFKLLIYASPEVHTIFSTSSTPSLSSSQWYTPVAPLFLPSSASAVPTLDQTLVQCRSIHARVLSFGANSVL